MWNFEFEMEIRILIAREEDLIMIRQVQEQKQKKPVDERLQAQLLSRKALLTEYSRVPELNPHAPSFVPVFNSSPHVPIMPVPMLNNLLNLQASSFTPRLPFPPELLSHLLPNTVNSLPATSPVSVSSSPTVLIPPTQSRSTDLSQFVGTFKEFVPASFSSRQEGFSPTESIEESPSSPPSQVQSPSFADSKHKVQRPAYVPPHLRNRKPEVSKPDKKRELTEDEKDRQKNRERKGKAMALKSEEDRPAYGSFKNTKTRRNSFTRVSQPVPVERSPPRSESPPAKPFTLADDYEFTSDEDLERDWADDDIEDSVLEEISILGLNLKRSYDIVIPNYMLEIYDFPKSVRTRDLIAAFSSTYEGFSVRWIDDTHALAIFRSKNQCEEALKRGGSGEFRVRELSKSSDVSRRKAASVAKEQRWEASTNAVRPEMNPSVAKRMIAANLDSVIAKQIRSAEREERALKGESSSPVHQKASQSTSSHFVQNPLTVGGLQS